MPLECAHSLISVFIYLISCAPVNLSNQDGKSTQENTISEKLNNIKSENRVIEKKEDEKEMVLEDVVLDKTIIALFANDDDVKIRKQFRSIILIDTSLHKC